VAKGRYIAFLDDDDEWKSDKLARQLEAIKSHDAVLCGALVNGSHRKIHGSTTVTVDDLRRGNPFDPSGLLVKASVVRDLRFDEELKWGEDWDMCIRLAQRYSIGYVQEPLVLYSDGEHQRITNDARYRTGAELEKRAAVLKKHRGFFGEALYKYYYAHVLLSYLGKRGSKLQYISYAVKRCGVVSVARVMACKLWGYWLGFVRAGTMNTSA